MRNTALNIIDNIGTGNDEDPEEDADDAAEAQAILDSDGSALTDQISDEDTELWDVSDDDEEFSEEENVALQLTREVHEEVAS